MRFCPVLPCLALSYVVLPCWLLSGNGHRGAGYASSGGSCVLHGATAATVCHGEGWALASALRGGAVKNTYIFVSPMYSKTSRYWCHWDANVLKPRSMISRNDCKASQSKWNVGPLFIRFSRMLIPNNPAWSGAHWVNMLAHAEPPDKCFMLFLVVRWLCSNCLDSAGGWIIWRRTWAHSALNVTNFPCFVGGWGGGITGWFSRYSQERVAR